MRMADIAIINKVDSASQEGVETVRANILEVRPWGRGHSRGVAHRDRRGGSVFGE